jgi:hypothetical protein
LNYHRLVSELPVLDYESVVCSAAFLIANYIRWRNKSCRPQRAVGRADPRWSVSPHKRNLQCATIWWSSTMKTCFQYRLLYPSTTMQWAYWTWAVTRERDARLSNTPLPSQNPIERSFSWSEIQFVCDLNARMPLRCSERLYASNLQTIRGRTAQ